MSIPVKDVIGLLGYLDEAFELGGKLLEAAQQRDPRLITEPIVDAGTAARAARERALRGPDWQEPDDPDD